MSLFDIIFNLSFLFFVFFMMKLPPLLLKIFYIGLWGVCGCNLEKWCGFP